MELLRRVCSTRIYTNFERILIFAGGTTFENSY